MRSKKHTCFVTWYHLCSVLLVFMLSGSLSAQQYIYISKDGIRKFLRVNIGASQWSIKQQDSSARKATGIHLLNELKVVSAFVKKENRFAIHDAFYFDINLGIMTSTPRSLGWSSGPEHESKFSVCTDFGYLGLAGYRTEKWAALGGVDFRWRKYSVGGTDIPELNGPLFSYSIPLVLRGEYCISKESADKRILLMLWYGKGNSSRPSYQNVRVELPLGNKGRWWLFGQYIHQSSLSQDNFMIRDPRPSDFQQWILGLRIGNLP